MLPLNANDPLNRKLSKESLDFNLICAHSQLVMFLARTERVSRYLLVQNREDTSVPLWIHVPIGQANGFIWMNLRTLTFASTLTIIMARFAGAYSRYSRNSQQFHALNSNIQCSKANVQSINYCVNSTSRQSWRRVYAWDRRFGGTNVPLNLLSCSV